MSRIGKSVTRATLEQALPDGGLFGGGSWQWSPTPFVLPSHLWRELEGLGHVLAVFQKACDVLYRRSAKGKEFPWLAPLLDKGKPEWLLEYQRRGETADQMPRVIRPDLLLTDEGFSLTEIDSVPGGIGITTWLMQQYENAGYELLGSSSAMLDGFGAVLPAGGAVALSEEATDYGAEMRWLVESLGGGREVVRAEDLDEEEPRPLYRFFELFDWENLPFLQGYANRNPPIQAPLKAHLEEKLWLALFHTPGLKSAWQTHLRGAQWQRLRKLIPQGWVMEPMELPPQACLPGLEISTWEELMNFSQSERELVLKVSGFDPQCWGSRGVYIGHDLPQKEWKERVASALADPTRAWILQQFSATSLIQHPMHSADGIKAMDGRVRLCPYYFTDALGKTKLCGCLVTIVPADKKKIHGMSDGILTVAARE
jgi:hypothetical protein